MCYNVCSAVASNIQPFRIWKCVFTHATPPLCHAFSSKLWRVVTDSKINETGVVV